MEIVRRPSVTDSWVLEVCGTILCVSFETPETGSFVGTRRWVETPFT